MRHLIILLYLILMGLAPAIAQEDTVNPQNKPIIDREIRQPQEFDQNYIEALKRQEEFNYLETAPEESWWTRFKKWIGNIWYSIWEALFGDIQAGSILQFILLLLPYLILAAILVLAVWLFIKLDPGGSFMKQSEKGEVLLSEDEKIIKSADIAQLIEKAKADKNYRLAVRYYYLLVLKQLTEMEIIIFQSEKTNEDYVTEINIAAYKSQFQTLTHLYDFIWYGDFGVTEADFFKIENQFQKMTGELQKAAHD